MAFISQTRMVANAWLRPGNTAESSSCKAFLQETIEEILTEIRIGLVRADSGFYTEEILSYIESQNLNYIIATRMYLNIKNEVYGLDDWISFCPGIGVNQMYFEHEKGTKRRYIVVRKEVEKRPKQQENYYSKTFPDADITAMLSP